MNSSYRLPICYLNSTLTEMAFYHAVFYLLNHKQPALVTSHSRQWEDLPKWSWRSENLHDTWRRVESNTEQLKNLTGMSQTAVNKFRNNLLSQPSEAPYTLNEEEGGEFVFHMPQYDIALQSKFIRVPNTFVENGWLKLLCENNASRFRLAVINQLLRQPEGKRYATLPALRYKTKLRHRKTPPSLKQILDVVRDLEQLGLVKLVEGELYQLNMKRLALQPAISKTSTSTFHANSTPIVLQAFSEDSKRAQLALDCLTVGQFDLESTFPLIFHDLQYINHNLERDRLLKKISRSETSLIGLPSADRWRQKWSNYRVALKRDLNRVTSPKIPISLAKIGEQSINLQVNHLDQVVKGLHLHYSKLVLWIQDDFAVLSNEVKLSLMLLTVAGDQLWQKDVSSDDRESRADITKAIRDRQQPLTFIIQNDQPLWDVSLSVCIEAYYLSG